MDCFSKKIYPMCIDVILSHQKPYWISVRKKSINIYFGSKAILFWVLSMNRQIRILTLSMKPSVLEKLKVEDKISYLMGDYNINLLNYSSQSLTSDFVDRMHSYSFFSLITRPTRITENSATLIDNIFVNKPYLSSFQAILVTDISDHLPIMYIDTKCPPINSDDFVYRRNLSQGNKQAFRLALANLSWEEIYHETDMQRAYLEKGWKTALYWFFGSR